MSDTQRAHAHARQQAAFSRPDEQYALLMNQALEHFENPLLRWHVEIDQQIAAEHEVITALPGAQCRIENIADL
ncbi:hypothetical protein D3C79_1089640 [compost metagenome]